MRALFFVSLVAAVGLIGCATTESVSSQVRKRAAFDLDCAEEQISLAPLSGSGAGGNSTYGAKGCGKRISYNTACGFLYSDCKIDADAAAVDAPGAGAPGSEAPDTETPATAAPASENPAGGQLRE